MELELGLKLARVADEFSSADFHIAKDGAGPLFLSTETDVSFNLTAYLRGYKKRNVKIEINEDGNQIVISGEKAIQESIFVDWKLLKKETEMRGFKKTFKIPDGVILDKIKANFDEDESMVTVSMPKKEKGIRGFSIEEVKDPVPHVLVTSESHQVTDVAANEKLWNTPQNDEDMLEPTCSSTAVDNNTEITEDHEKKSINPQESEGPSTILEKDTTEKDEHGEVKSSDQRKEEGIPLDHRETEKEREREEKGSFKICVPAIAGTAFLLSFVVFVIHYIQTKTTPNKRKD